MTLTGLQFCEECGASIRRRTTRSRYCDDCLPKPVKEKPIGVRELALQRTRVLRSQGLTDKQIAAALGVRPQTVKNRLKRARERGLGTQRGAR